MISHEVIHMDIGEDRLLIEIFLMLYSTLRSINIMMSLEVHSAPELQIQELTGIIRADGFLIFRWDV